MSYPIPPPSKTKQRQFQGRWRWWYAAICDYRITHPGCTHAEIAAHINRHADTVSNIVNTDLYREYEAQRMQRFRDEHDDELRLRLTGVATKALDVLTIQLEKKRDQIPLEIIKDIAVESLDRLGFAPQRGPSVVVHNQQVALPNAVSPAALEEARSALRAVEARKASLPEVEAQLVLAEEPEAPQSGDSQEVLGPLGTAPPHDPQ